MAGCGRGRVIAYTASGSLCSSWKPPCVGDVQPCPATDQPQCVDQCGRWVSAAPGYTIVWCGWQHDVPAVDGLMRIKVPGARQAVIRSPAGCW
jgi:hypothetical protein